MFELKQKIETFNNTDIIFGLSYPQWTVLWWKWWCRSSPGEPKQAEQGDITKKVFFLTTKKMERFNNEVLEVYNTIPQDMAILFPVDKWLSIGFFPFTPDNILKDIAKTSIDNLPNISISLDGLVNNPIRIQSDVFQLELERDIQNPEIPENLKNISKGNYKAVGEGYWIFLKPNSLKKGNHQMSSFASCKTGELSLEVRQYIDII
jgi:hypothetical protein